MNQPSKPRFKRHTKLQFCHSKICVHLPRTRLFGEYLLLWAVIRYGENVVCGVAPKWSGINVSHACTPAPDEYANTNPCIDR